MDKARIAVIGVGYFGELHAKKLKALDNARLVAVVDIRRDRAMEVAAALGARAEFSHSEILADIDAAVVAASSPSHAEIVRDLLLAGKDVLCEKPMTMTLPDSDELVALAAERNRILQVGHLERFNPAVEALLRCADAPCFIEANRIAPIKRRALDIDVVMDVMLHDIDIVLALTGSQPVEVRAVGAPVVGRYPDIVNARLEFPGGCVANLTASRLALKEERRMRVFQPESYLTLDLLKSELLVVNDVKFKDNGLPKITYERLHFPQSDALELELRSFADCVLRRTPPRVDGGQAREVLACALRIREKVEEGLIGRSGVLSKPGRWIGLEEDK